MIRKLLLGAAIVTLITGVIFLQRWEGQAAQERIAFRVATLEAFANEEYDVALIGLTTMAKEDLPKAQSKLAFLYANGLAVERTVETALQWYRAAADQGDKDAKLAIAKLLEDEKHDLKNQALALALYQELAAFGVV